MKTFMESYSERFVGRLPIEYVAKETKRVDDYSTKKQTVKFRPGKKVVGSATHATVYEDGPGKVVRIGGLLQDDPYHHFALTSKLNHADNPHLPKVHTHRVLKSEDTPRRMAITRMERLHSNHDVERDYIDNMDTNSKFDLRGHMQKALSSVNPENPPEGHEPHSSLFKIARDSDNYVHHKITENMYGERHPHLDDFKKRHSSKFVEALDHVAEIASETGGRPDLHASNFMYRKNDDGSHHLVITDPLTSVDSDELPEDWKE